MKRLLLTFAIVLPFLWFKPQAKAQTQPVNTPSVATWNLPKEIISNFKNSVVYRGVSSWFSKLFDF